MPNDGGDDGGGDDGGGDEEEEEDRVDSDAKVARAEIINVTLVLT